MREGKFSHISAEHAADTYAEKQGLPPEEIMEIMEEKLAKREG